MQDSHTHLTTEPLYGYIEQALDNFVKKGGLYLLNIACDIESSYKVLEVGQKYKKQYPNLIQNSIGIHPERYYPENKLVDEDIGILKDIFSENKENIHAIGETGLQYYNLLNRHDLSFDEKEKVIERQKISLKEHIDLAIKNDLPISLHARDEKDSDYCTKDILEIITKEGHMKLRGIMHSYVGQEKYMHSFLELGLYIGFNAIITYKSGQSVRDMLKNVPLERILLETDSPYLPTQSVRADKKRAIRFGQPEDIYEIAEAVGEVKNISVEKVLRTTTENYKKLFKI